MKAKPLFEFALRAVRFFLFFRTGPEIAREKVLNIPHTTLYIPSQVYVYQQWKDYIYGIGT